MPGADLVIGDMRCELVARQQMNTYHGKECPKHKTTLRMSNNRQCRECHLESKRKWAKTRKRDKIASMMYSRLRQSNMLKAKPKWVDPKEIKEIYDSRCPGQHVDHIVPLKGVDRKSGVHIVCGLHVPWNLRVIEAKDNDSKWAYFDE